MYPSVTVPIRVEHYNRGFGYGVSGITGVVAAALAQDSIILALLCDPQAGVANAHDKLSMYFDRLRLAFTCLTGFTTPITAARRLAVYRAAGVASTGGAALGVVKKDSTSADQAVPTSVCTDARIATVAALGVAGIVREANPIMTLDLTHVGAAGARQDWVFELSAPLNAPQAINPGELLVVSNPVLFDAVGTFQLSVDECHWIEAKRFPRG